MSNIVTIKYTKPTLEYVFKIPSSQNWEAL